MSIGVTLVILTVICWLFVFLTHRGNEHAEEINEMKEAQRKAQAEINSLNNKLSSMSARQSRYEDAEAQATRLLQEQIALKMDAMDACKAMLRESWRNH